MDENHELLFSYGTLQSEAIQLATFGRKLHGAEDALVGYRVKIIRIEDLDFVAASGTEAHRDLEFTGDPADYVEGTVYKVTPSELEQADAYEPNGYKRVLVQSRAGRNVWVYLQTT